MAIKKLKPFIETERLILREILPEDEQSMFEMDSDPEVHRYLGNDPVKDIEQTRNVIKFIRQQYIDNGIGRWAVIEKSSGNFIGWSGLKYYTEKVNNHIHIYELGYRFSKRYWGLGYATESAKAWVDHGFDSMNLKEIYAMTDSLNKASNNVLLKLGFKYIESFDYNGDHSDWFMIKNK